VFSFCTVLTLAATPGQALERGEFDPTAFDVLVKEYVKDGRVDYEGWQAAGIEALDAFLDEAGEYDLTSTMGKEPKASFLINAYNAWAIRQILEHYPVESVKDIPGFFDSNKRLIAGEYFNLNGIEEKLADLLRNRPYFANALVPGTSGWPKLASEAYSTDTYEALTVESMKSLIGDAYLRYDAEKNLLHVPAPISRHMDLFEAMPKGLVGHLSGYLPLGDIVAISKHKPKHVRDDIDWSLNDSRARPGGDEAKDKTK
jgi:hypothetical protein